MKSGYLQIFDTKDLNMLRFLFIYKSKDIEDFWEINKIRNELSIKAKKYIYAYFFRDHISFIYWDVYSD